MAFESQEVAGATEFDGTAGQGLFTFADMVSFVSTGYCPIIHSIYVTCGGAAPRVQIYRALPATPAAERQLLVDEVGNCVGIRCDFTQPKADDNTQFFLYIVTTGKSAAGRAELHWSPGRIV